VWRRVLPFRKTSLSYVTGPVRPMLHWGVSS
jgi:hypothetical protein